MSFMTSKVGGRASRRWEEAPGAHQSGIKAEERRAFEAALTLTGALLPPA
jgi:hypothetical protein